MLQNDGLISVVMPVYNGDQYIQESISSVLSQTYTNFEFLIIDDGSLDKSLIVLKEFETKDSRIKVFHKKNEGTVAKAINHILSHVSGQFFFYLSQDDKLSSDLFEKMILRYTETSADVVLPDLVYMFDNDFEKNYSLVGYKGNRDVYLTGRQGVVYSLDWQIHGFGLWNSIIIKELGFDDFALNSDEFSTRKFFLNCKRIVFSAGTFFYRQRPNSITKKLSPKIFDFAETNRRLYLFLCENNFDKQIIDKQLLTNAMQLIISTKKFILKKKTFSNIEVNQIKNKLLNAYNEIKYFDLIKIFYKQKFIKIRFSYYMVRNFNYFLFCCKVENYLFRLRKKLNK